MAGTAVPRSCTDRWRERLDFLLFGVSGGPTRCKRTSAGRVLSLFLKGKKSPRQTQARVAHRDKFLNSQARKRTSLDQRMGGAGGAKETDPFPNPSSLLGLQDTWTNTEG